MLRCADASYYMGHTDDLEKRVAEHQAGEKCAYTFERRPVRLMWSQEFWTREEADDLKEPPSFPPLESILQNC
ncbi:MAG: GIY-YIG nuclease family protein [Deltaproteobacteria bacterium]|nr:GIY-YIG nuclease family protein [Deltaproteobacteria bacterium]MCZ6563659.1 GIY-YIG nuclease family protein [Deltaproteobacteria bacterium]